jgi:hypothetical protein
MGSTVRRPFWNFPRMGVQHRARPSSFFGSWGSSSIRSWWAAMSKAHNFGTLTNAVNGIAEPGQTITGRLVRILWSSRCIPSQRLGLTAAPHRRVPLRHYVSYGRPGHCGW